MRGTNINYSKQRSLFRGRPMSLTCPVNKPREFIGSTITSILTSAEMLKNLIILKTHLKKSSKNVPMKCFTLDNSRGIDML